MDELKYWLAFNSIEGVGSISIMKIKNHFNSISDAWNASPADYQLVSGLYPNILEKLLLNKPKIIPDQLYENVLKSNIKVLCIEDDHFPDLLKQIHDCPVILFYLGDLEACNLKRTIGIVGTRTPTEYAQEATISIAKELSGYGITIVSGLAEGIDTQAHTSCLDNNGKTIAILGSGLNYVYPKINQKLFERIISDSNGVVMTEYPPDSKPDSWKFPYRNRIISGLSYAVIVAESKARGGGLITAKYALEQNRDVFGIPSRVNNSSNDGVLNLIKKAEAKIFISCLRLFDHLNWEVIIEKQEESCSSDIKEEIAIKEPAIEDKSITPDSETINLDNADKDQETCCFSSLSPEESEVLKILSLEPIQFDLLLTKTSLKASRLLGILTFLELKGLIIQLQGKKYKAVTH